MEKYYPKVGTPLYLHQRTGNCFVDDVKRPYTVIAVSKQHVVIQGCKLIAPIYHCCGNPYLDRPDLEGQRVFFYDTVAESIEPDPEGEILELNWAPKKGCWQIDTYKTGYPQIAKFGKYEHFPYLN